MIMWWTNDDVMNEWWIDEWMMIRMMNDEQMNKWWIDEWMINRWTDE